MIRMELKAMINIDVLNLGNNNYEIIKTFNNECKVGDKLTFEDLNNIMAKRIPRTTINYFYKH